MNNENKADELNKERPVAFTVDRFRKKKIQKNYLHSRKGWMALSYGLLSVIVLFTIIFTIYGFGIKNTFLIYDPSDTAYLTKDTLLVWLILLTGDFILVFLWLVQYKLANGISGKYIGQRVNESLIISDTLIEYGYQNAVGQVPGDRIVITLRLQTIREINIDKTLSRVEIWADEIRSVYYDRFSDGVKMTRADGKYEAASFVAFDYFEPSLIKYIEANLSQYYITVSAEDRPWTHEKQKLFLPD